MRKFYPLLFSLLFAASICAQQGNEVVQIASAKTRSAETPAKGSVKIGGVEVPPEKLRPVTIPKFAAPIVIDGKPDEAAWADAAVFKDFYQTGPVTISHPQSRPKCW